MPSLVDDLGLLKGYRESNPDLSQLSDTQLTDLVNSQTGELAALKDSSAIGRLLGKTSLGLNNLGRKAEVAIAPEGASFPRQVAGRAASNLVSMAPELAMNYAAARVLPQSKLGFGLIAGLNTAEQYGRTMAETGDKGAALGAGASALTSLGGSVIGARVGLGSKGRALADRGLKAGLKGRVGQAVGSYVGGIPGDVLGVATMPGGLKEFVSDPVNIPAYLLAQVGAAGVGEAMQAGSLAKAKVEKVKALTPSLDEFAPRTMEQEHIQLQKIPVSQLTEQQVARKSQIETEFKQQDVVKKQKAIEQQMELPFQNEVKAYSVNRDLVSKKYADSDTPFKYIGFQEGIGSIAGDELWNAGPNVPEGLQPNSTYFRRSLERMGHVLPEMKPVVEGIDFSVEHHIGQHAFTENKLLENLQKSFQATSIKGAKFQRDPIGLVSSKGLKRAIEEWTPKAFLDHYKQAGLDTLLATDKVQPEQVASWIRENTPSIEVKKIIPFQVSQESQLEAKLIHEAETLGATVQGSYVFKDSNIPIDHNDLAPSTRLGQIARDLYSIREKQFDLLDKSDAATGRYGVEPISVDKMDRPVDILVREPTKQDAFNKGLISAKPGDPNVKFRGPHFGDSDKNVIASIRGYFPDPDTFLAFEVQSDWAQNAKNLLTVGSEHGAPILSSYETIALKTAIQHALDNGATHIVIPDGKTVSMIEGHDVSNRLEGNFDSLPPQYKGMQQHYDRNLPDIMRKLTRDKGERVSLGDMDRKASAAFGGKKDISGLKFQLDNLHPDVEKMFSVYGWPQQYDFAKQLSKLGTMLEREIATKEAVPMEQFLDATLRGEPVDKAVALGYLKTLVGSERFVKMFNATSDGGMTILGFTHNGDIAINTSVAQRAFRTTQHELSHVAYERLSPAAKADIEGYVHSIDPITRQAMLEQLFSAVKLEGMDAAYLAGNNFSPSDPQFRAKVAKEFMAGIAEVLAHDAYENRIKINETVGKYLSWMPMGMQSWLTQLVSQTKRFFGSQYPSLRHFLDDEQTKFLGGAYDKLIEFTKNSQEAQAAAYKQLKQTGLFDEGDFLNKIPTRYETNQWSPAIKKLSAMPNDEARDYALNWLKESRLVTKTADFWENNFMSALYRTKLIPETLGFFRELHHYRSNIREKELGYLGYLGQDENNSLSYEQALESAQKKLDSITSSSGLLLKMSKIISANDKIREEALNPTEPGKPPVPFVTEDMLVQPKEMMEKYGLSEDQANLMSRIVKIPALVAEQTLRQMQAADTVNTAKLLYLQNKNQDIASVKERSAQLTRIASEQGKIQFQRHYLEHLLEQKMRTYGDAADPQEVNGFKQQIDQLKQQELGNKMLFEAETRRMFGTDIGFSPEVGKDLFIDNLHNLTARLGEARAEQEFVMKDEGYAPMTRRGRFLLRVFKRGENGAILPKTKEFRGFNELSRLRDYMKKNKISDSEVEIMDKEKFEERAQMYSPKQLQAVRDRARDDLSGFIREYQQSVNEKDPNKKVTMKVLSDIMDQYKPLEREIAEVISVKGDKFRQRRWRVAGFDEADFIPNIMEYMSYKTASAQKAVTRAEAELQMLQKRVQDDPNLNVRMQRELDYVLNRTNEWSGARKFVFYTYLGASVRHMLQNTMQIPLNGIPEMMHQGAGFHAYGHALKASKLLGQYLATGSTGNKTFDVLLKEGEKSGITIPNAVEMVAPETDVIQTALDHASSWANGKTDIGGKVKLESLKFKAATEKFMRSTAVASEMTNRKISFIMSLLESERKGVKDPRQMYNSANQFTDYVNFVGDKSNRPGFQIKLGQTWAHAPVLLATAMQSFVINHLSQLYAYNKLAWKGDKNARAALATGTFHLLAAAGVMGLPFASNAEQLFESATGISLKTAMREKLINLAGMLDFSEDAGGRFADSVISGFPNFVGVDTGSSLGLGDPIFQWRAGQDTSAMDLAGPAGNVVDKYSRGLSALAADPTDPNQWSAAVRAVAPQALNQAIKIMDAISDGDFKDSRGNPVVKSLDGGSSLATFTGFSPRQATKVRDLNFLRMKNEKRLSAEYKNAVELTANALTEFETTKNPAALQRAQQHFQKFVDSRAGTQNRSSFVSSISAIVSERLRGGQKPTNLTEQSSFETIQKAYPDTEYHYSEALPSAVDELKVAQLLGQSDVAMTKAKSLQTAALPKALYDSLVQAGIPPATASLIAQHSKSALQRLSEVQTGSSPFPVGAE